MITIDFNGYGAEYTIGKLKTKEIENIEFLLERFDVHTFMEKYELIWGEDRREFYEFDDFYQVWSVYSDFTATIRETAIDNNSQFKHITFIVPDTEYKTIDYTDNEGFFICSCNIEKGCFFSITLDVDLEDFDSNLLKFHYDDLSLTWLSDIVLTGISYNGENIEMNYDDVNTVGKGFCQKLIYIDDGNEYDGIEILTDKIDLLKYKILDDVSEDDTIMLDNYICLSRSKTLKPLSTPIVWHSPMMYDRFPKEDVDDIWFTKNEIKKAISLDMITEIPSYIWERVKKEKPEWLI